MWTGGVGVVNATVEFQGKAAHSARPWLGTNAVTRAGTWLAEMDGREPEAVEVAGLTFYETFAVTRAQGGVANNIVPGTFTLNLNHRFGPHRTVEEAQRRVEEMAAGADQVTVTDTAPPAPIPEDNPFLDRIVAATGAPMAAKQAWTDVARLASYGVAAVNYGPGETAQAHQVTESVAVESLDVAYRALERFLTAE